MATALSFNSAKSTVISLLQASQTPWATTVDGSNQQYSSDAEISNAILTADGILATTIANTLQSPYQSTFVQTSGALASGASLPARNGMILKVTCLDSPITTLTFTSAQVNITDDSIDFSPNLASSLYGLATGLRVQFTTGGALPTGLSLATDYWISANLGPALILVCSNMMAAANDIPINLTNAGSGTSTMVMQYEDGIQAMSKDQILAVNSFPNLYGTTFPVTAKFWFIEGDVIYTTSSFAKVVYTDYTLTASPQCPEPFLEAVAAGAVAYLAKDGGDQELAGYYQGIFNEYLQMTATGAMALPAISSYKMAA